MGDKSEPRHDDPDAFGRVGGDALALDLAGHHGAANVVDQGRHLVYLIDSALPRDLQDVLFLGHVGIVRDVRVDVCVVEKVVCVRHVGGGQVVEALGLKY